MMYMFMSMAPLFLSGPPQYVCTQSAVLLPVVVIIEFSCFFNLNYLFRWKNKYMFVFFWNTNWSWSMGSKGYQSGINHCLFIIYTQYLSWNFCWISRHLLQESWPVNGIFLEKVKVHIYTYWIHWLIIVWVRCMWITCSFDTITQRIESNDRCISN